jgi:hypothetical protein
MYFLKLSLVLATLAFAWLRFSDNTVDNDLWGHVLYGQRYWNHDQIRETEKLSWTAAGFPVVNHEYLAEIVMGWVHRIAGGSGLLFYMLGMGLVTVSLAFFGGSEPRGAHRWTAWILFAASINFIAIGFAVRPQLFTTLFLVVELIVLREIANGRFAWAFLLPPLFALWINFHGGVIAGVLVVFLLAAVETVHALWPRRLPETLETTRPPRKNLRVYWLLLFAAVIALLANPWGATLVRWNIDAIRLPRPQINEWQPLTLSAAHAPFYIVALVSLLAWIFSRQSRPWWEAAALLMFAAMGILHQRHTPLFGLANLVLSPRHLQDAALRLAPRARALLSLLARPAVQAALAAVLLASTGASLAFSFAPKDHPFTMEVEQDVYPVAAVEFMREHRLVGKTITFFDWGQQNLWELPENPVSFDGRFDTGYPRDVIAAHWDFYAGRALRPAVRWDDADVALLPAECPGIALLRAKGWRAVYRDPLAAVLVPPHGPHAGFMAGQRLRPRSADAVSGRVPFPDTPAVLATAAAPR